MAEVFPEEGSISMITAVHTQGKLPPCVKDATKPPKFRIVGAIDLGTKFSGYAFKVVRDQQQPRSAEIYVNTEWEGSDLQYKTASCILTTKDGILKSFGLEAQNDYKIMDDEEKSDALFFDMFKLMLDKSERRQARLDESTLLRATGSKKTLPAIKVFSLVLFYLREHMTDKLKETTELDLQYEDILWVLTVPAIWDNSAKGFMRLAARKAGLVRGGDDDRLIIALEPEAAALHCRTLVRADGVRQIRSLQEGETYLVIDCGGGTVDITVHQVLEGNTVKEVHKATGGIHGGREVDRCFEALLCDVFGQDFMRKYKEKQTSDFLLLIEAFELAKKQFNFEKGRPINIQIPNQFFEACSLASGCSVQDQISSFKRRSEVDISLRSNSFLSIGAQDAKELLFDPVLGDIEKICAELQGLENLEVVFLVGGFATCPLLKARIQRVFQDRANVILPKDPGLSILKGAVLYGENPTVITQRIMSQTYGLELPAPWDDSKGYDKQRQCEEDGKKYCRDTFHKLVEEGEAVPIDQPVKVTLNARSNLFSLKIFVSSEKDPLYTSDQSCSFLGTVIGDIPQAPWRPQSPVLDFYFFFGYTELKVVVTESDTDQLVCRANVRYGEYGEGATGT